MKKIIILIVLVLFNLSSLVQAKPPRGNLSEEEVGRVKDLRQMTIDVEKKSLQQMIDELVKSSHPDINLIIKEAMAKTYVDIVQKEHVQGQYKKEWLYSMIALNMAYFQFGGDKDSAGGVQNLNKLIRQKLKMYLPPNIFNQPGFHASLG